jgi:serine incorporator 1/3
VASLLTACCGNEKLSSVPPSATSGRKRSVLLLVLAVAMSLGFQYGVAPMIANTAKYSGWIAKKWFEGCNDFDTLELREQCAGISGVYRVGAATFLFLALATVAAYCKPTANREAWPAKYVIWFFLCAGTIFIGNEPLFSDIYLNIARAGAVLFICLQQIIIIDISYNWNDAWVEKSNQADREEFGSGARWLRSILAYCALFYTIGIVGLALLLGYFTGCPSNNSFIALTIVFSVLVLGAQLSGEEASLLSSSCIFLWSVFLCYTAVVKNPDETCNPQLGEVDNVSIVLGILITLVSLAWTGWSLTAEEKLNLGSNQKENFPRDDVNTISGKESAKVTGIVTGASYGTEAGAQDHEAADFEKIESPSHLSNSGSTERIDDRESVSSPWKLNLVLLVVTCWMTMVLTNFGIIASDGSVANPQVGKAAMWVVIGSQWFVLSLYLWTLVAPRMFPDRDFS